MSQKVELRKVNSVKSPAYGKYFWHTVYEDHFVETGELADFIQQQASIKRSDIKATLDDLYQPLRADYPDRYRNKVTSEMRRYADELKARPAYHRFCERFHLNHDEFIRDVYDTAVSMISEKC